jgi:cytidine deaminase
MRPIPASRSARRCAARRSRSITGCNVENVAYPEGTCAEAGAIAAMVAAGETEIAEVAVIADSPEPVPALRRLPPEDRRIRPARRCR